MEVREKITKAALRLFLLNDYVNVSVREISVLAGVSNTYTHKIFGTKRNIFRAVLKEADDDFYLLVKDEYEPTRILNLYLTHKREPLFQLLATNINQRELDGIWIENEIKSLNLLKSLYLDDAFDDMRFFIVFSHILFSPLVATSNLLQSLGLSSSRADMASGSADKYAVGFQMGTGTLKDCLNE